MQEVFRVLVEGHHWTHVILAALTLGLSSYAIVLASQAIVTATKFGNRDSLVPAEDFVLVWLPVLLGLAIPFSLARALFVAASSSFVLSTPVTIVADNPILGEILRVSEDASRIVMRLRVAGMLSVVLSLVIAAGMRRYARRCHARWVAFVSLHWMTVTITAGAAVILLSVLFAISSRPAVFLGTIPVLSLFTILLVFVLSGIRIGFYGSGFSPVGAALLCAFVFSLLGWNNNHLEPMIPLRHSKDLFNAAGPQLAFEQWYSSRKDLDFFANAKKPYPIFIIAAQGGGVYAASQAALFLSRMQDRCPNFSQHVFAISSVSGGSIGSAFFASVPPDLIKNQTWEPCHLGPMTVGPIEERARSFVQSDLLSPTVASAIFPDLLQRFIPIRIGFADRGKALDGALVRAWSDSQHADANPFQQQFLERWDPTSATPALIINSTEVDSGRRTLIAPFAINSLRAGSQSQQSWFYETAEMKKALTNYSSVPPVKEDLQLSQAVGISARFPWILPAATVKRGEDTLQLVDGGYFDNSGIETAVDLIEDLVAIRQASGGSKNFEIHLITDASFAYDSPVGWRGLDDLLSPVRVLLSAREARGGLSFTRAATSRFFYCGYNLNCPPLPYDISPAAILDQQDFGLALGFQLSNNSVNLIETQVGDPSRCSDWFEREADSEKTKRLVEFAHGNSCVPCTMQYWLHGDKGLPTGIKFPCDPHSQRKSEE
jgi:hypothetical protein